MSELRPRRFLVTLCLAAALVASGCDDGPSEPTPDPGSGGALAPGAIALTVATTGQALDADGYSVRVSGGTAIPVPVNGAVSIPEVAAGEQQIELSGVANNCTVGGSLPRTVQVPSKSTASVTFTIQCVAVTGTVKVLTTTDGLDIDLDADGYQFGLVGGTPAPIAGAAEGWLTEVAPGTREIALTELQPNCAVTSANPAAVDVVAGVVAQVTFTVSCAPNVGRAHVVVNPPTGGSFDPDGYELLLAGASQSTGLAGEFTFADVRVGAPQLDLSGLAANCSVTGGASRVLDVRFDETSDVVYDVTCTASDELSTLGIIVNFEPDAAFAYGIEITGGPTVNRVGDQAFTLFDQVAVGLQRVTLTGLPASCTVHEVETGEGNGAYVDVIPWSAGAGYPFAGVNYEVNCQ